MAKIKKTKKKAVRKPAKKARKKTAAPKRRQTAAATPKGLSLAVPPELEQRLRALARDMQKSVDQVLVQALQEFADNWEDHMRTVQALGAEDDRVQLSVPQE